MALAHETGGIATESMDAMLERREMHPEDFEMLAKEFDRAARRLRHEAILGNSHFPRVIRLDTHRKRVNG